MALQQQNVKKIAARCLIAFGSNLSNEFGASVQLLEAASVYLSRKGLFKVEMSGFFRTPAFPKGSGPDFVNSVGKFVTDLSAADVLEVLHEVESLLGRERKVRWGARVIDLDLIDFDGQIAPDRQTYERWVNLPLEKQMQEAPEQMILPHPRLQDRLFVLVPLADVQADWVHPVTGHSVAQMIAGFDRDALAEVQPMNDSP